jgi:hypothetical protein
MKKVRIAIIILAFVRPVVAQQTASYDHFLVDYRTALELFEKEKYSASMELFDNFLNSGKINQHHEAFVNSRFHSAMCAVYLKRNDAENRLLSFEIEFPHSPQVQLVYY